MAEWSRKKVNVYLEGSHCNIDSQQHMLKGAKRFADTHFIEIILHFFFITGLLCEEAVWSISLMKPNVRYLMNGTSFISMYRTRQHLLKINLNASSVAVIEARIKLKLINSLKYYPVNLNKIIIISLG